MGCMRQSRASRSGEEILLCSALLRPRGQCSVQFWAPQYQKDVGFLEQPARGHGDEGRLRELGLSSLESRRLRGILSLCRNT